MKLSPKKLYTLDGIGALCSAFFLGVILVHFNSLVGIPVSSLYLLAIIPCLYAILDLYFLNTKNPKHTYFLRTLVFLNSSYCILSLTIAYIHRKRITGLGWLHIITELIIIAFLVYLELKASKQPKLR